MKIGRNDPCPCGGGRKYKGPAGMFAEIRQALQGRQFSSLEDLQVFTDRFMRQRNQAPCDDFHGLSPEQMHRVLDFPFDSRELVTYYTWRALVNFSAFLGLAEAEPTIEDRYGRHFRVRKRPLLAEAVRFHISR